MKLHFKPFSACIQDHKQYKNRNTCIYTYMFISWGEGEGQICWIGREKWDTWTIQVKYHAWMIYWMLFNAAHSLQTMQMHLFCKCALVIKMVALLDLFLWDYDAGKTKIGSYWQISKAARDARAPLTCLFWKIVKNKLRTEIWIRHAIIYIRKMY